MSAETEEVVFRGVRWRRSASGRALWYNEGLKRWVTWHEGADAPPVPDRWARELSGAGTALAPGPAARTGRPTPTGAPEQAPSSGKAVARPGGAPGPVAPPQATDAMSTRAPMRSPYRLVPILIALAIVGVAVFEAVKPPARATQADIASAMALRGKCLPRGGGTPSAPSYSTSPVACSSPQAVVKVAAVVSADAPAGSCPRGTEVAVLVNPGVVGEPFECLEKLGARR